MQMQNEKNLINRVLKIYNEEVYYFGTDKICHMVLLDEAKNYDLYSFDNSLKSYGIDYSPEFLLIKNYTAIDGDNLISISLETFNMVINWLIEGYTFDDFIRDLIYYELNKNSIRSFSEKAKNTYTSELKNYQLANILFRLTSKDGYYFNTDGIYCSVPYDEILNNRFFNVKVGFNNNIKFMNPLYTLRNFEIFETSNFNIFKKAICNLPLGSTIDDFEKLVNNTVLESRAPLSDLERFVTKIEQPIIIKSPESPNGTFDYIRVHININTNWPEKKKYFITHKEEITEMILDKLQKNKSFKKNIMYLLVS